jgi:hypothetical protein
LSARSASLRELELVYERPRVRIAGRWEHAQWPSLAAVRRQLASDSRPVAVEVRLTQRDETGV